MVRASQKVQAKQIMPRASASFQKAWLKTHCAAALFFSQTCFAICLLAIQPVYHSAHIRGDSNCRKYGKLVFFPLVKVIREMCNHKRLSSKLKLSRLLRSIYC